MIRMIVVRPGCDDYVRLPFANLADDLFANLQTGQELAVVVIEHLVFDADASSRFLRLSTAPISEFLSVLRLMPSVAVRQRYELHLVAERSILGGETSGSEIAVVRMCAEGN